MANGVSGAPFGNQNAAKAKQWSAAIERVLCKRSGKDKAEALEELAEKFLAAVEQGDITAWREFGDRMEGKPSQQLVLSGDEDQPLTIVHESR